MLNARKYCWLAVAHKVGVWDGKGFYARAPCSLQLRFRCQAIQHVCNCPTILDFSHSPPLTLLKYFCFHRLFSATVLGGCHSQCCHGHLMCLAQIACGPSHAFRHHSPSSSIVDKFNDE